MENKKTIKFLIFLTLMGVFFIVSSVTVQAANIYFSPSSGSYIVGDRFSVAVYVSSANQAMNAASGIATFPTDRLRVTSLSRAGSIMSLWVQEPSFSNSAGTITFEGIVLNPGFIGSSGKIITVNFRVKAAGSAPLTFFSGSVLANDGRGTNILANLGRANFSLGGATPSIPEATTPAPTAILGVPGAPVIVSPTHPEPTRWYNVSTAEFGWDVPADIDQVRLLVGRIQNALPSVNYSPPISTRTIEDLSDGRWYFHAQFRNDDGWGGVSHFRFQIDTQSPDPFEITFVEELDPTDPQPIARFEAEDIPSGVDHYRVRINDGEFFEVSPEEVEGGYQLPPQRPGSHILLVEAYDRAGNFTGTIVEFNIESIESPVITDYPTEVRSGEPLRIGGRGPVGTEVTVWYVEGDGEPVSQKTRIRGDGAFDINLGDDFDSGIYTIWAEAIDDRGAISDPSASVKVYVGVGAFFRTITFLINAVGSLVVIIALVALVFGITWYSWRWFIMWKRRIKRDVAKTEKDIKKAFQKLKIQVRKEIRSLKRAKVTKGSTEKEDAAILRLEKMLEDSEQLLEKDVEEIKKDIL